MTDRIAANATQAAVQTAVNAAGDGDTVLIPNGSATWTTGITTTKQIIIRAQNYTPTPAGCSAYTGVESTSCVPRSYATTRNVTLTNNSSGSLFAFTSGNSYHCGLGGVRINEGTVQGAAVELQGTGSKVPLIFDCYFQYRNRDWPTAPLIHVSCLGGIMWNSVIEGNLGNSTSDQPGQQAIHMISTPRAWTTARTLGAEDVGGVVNLYLEDCTFINCGLCPDMNDHARLTVRYCDYNGGWAEAHAISSTWGARHFDYSDCRFRSTTAQRNCTRYFWAKGGSGVFCRLRVDNGADGYWGAFTMTELADDEGLPAADWNASLGMYNRQVGSGHNGSAYIRDPVYIWNHVGPRAYSWQYNWAGDHWIPYVREGYEFFVNAGAKPGYVAFTYPHPLRSAIEGGITPLPQGNTGIASLYPNDTGITGHASVIAGDGFESYTAISQLTSSGNWSNYYQPSNLLLDTSATNFYGGAKALRVRMPSTGSEVSNAIVRPISPTRDTLFVRAYAKHQAGYAGLNAAHNGIRITANYPGPGTIPNGTDFFYVSIENSRYRSETEPGYTNCYIYFPEQDDSYGEHWYPSGYTSNGAGPTGGFGPYFIARADTAPTRGQWICWEVMVQANTPGSRDGRIGVWQDGALIADWQNIRFRDVSTVKINEIQFENGGQGSTQSNDKWYDNIVVATSYIGPMVAATTPPTGTITLSVR